MAESVGAHSFHECSALTSEGVKKVFDGAVRAALTDIKPRGRQFAPSPERVRDQDCIIAVLPGTYVVL